MTSPTYPLTLVGKLVVDSDGTIADGYVTFETGRGKKGVITELGTSGPPSSYSGDYHVLADSQLIYPGMLNLHNHTTWDFIPLWHGESPPVFNYDNRFQWQADPLYFQNVSALEALIENSQRLPGSYPVATELTALTEIQSLCGGTTVLQENGASGGGGALHDHILLRGTGNSDDMGIQPPRFIDSIVKLYEPAGTVQHTHPDAPTGTWTVTQAGSFNGWQSAVNGGQVYSSLVHLSEGRYGWLQRGKDPYTRNEFTAFRDYVTQNWDPGQFANSRFNMIHGCGVDPDDPADVDFIKNYGLTILWSPVSNTMLYSDTLNISQLLDADISVCLTSDWAPSGSKHVWDEAKHAAILLTERLGMSTADAQQLLYKMITINPATAIDKQDSIGIIQKGGWADLFILDTGAPVTTSSNAVPLLFGASDNQTVGVYTGGMLVLADNPRFTPPGFSEDFQQLPAEDGPHASDKWVNFNANGDYPKLDAAAIASAITNELDAGGSVNVHGRQVDVPPNTYTRSKFLVTDDIDYQNYMADLDDWLAG